MISLLSAIVVLGILIFVHELGHFIFAKLAGVRVDKFSLGFGPRIIGKTVGETEYLISAFPLGGYVKMFGEGEEGEELTEEDKKRTFGGKRPLQRISIIAAGPVFNLLFAYIVFIVLFMVGFPGQTTKVGSVVEGKPAAVAGIAKGDAIISINGSSAANWDDVTRLITGSKGKPLQVVVSRGGEKLNFTVTPEMKTRDLLGELVPQVGIVSSGETMTQRFGIGESISRGTQQTWFVVKITVLSLVKLVQRVVPLDNIGGPIMIAKLAGQQAVAGGVSFFAFMALLSVNLAVLNLLPIPVLDGGHLMFNVIEAITGRPVSTKIREVAQQIGLVLLLGLMILAFYNDIAHYIIGQG